MTCAVRLFLNGKLTQESLLMDNNRLLLITHSDKKKGKKSKNCAIFSSIDPRRSGI